MRSGKLRILCKAIRSKPRFFIVVCALILSTAIVSALPSKLPYTVIIGLLCFFGLICGVFLALYYEPIYKKFKQETK